MAVCSIVKISGLEGAKRLDAEYYQPKYRIEFGKGSWVTIGDVSQLCQYGISQAMNEEPVGYPIFRMDDIKNAFLVDDVVKYLQIPYSFFEKYKMQTDDILFNRVNSEEFVGRTGIFKLAGDYVFASYLIRLHTKPNSPILPDYLNVFLNSSYGIKQIRKLSRRAVNQANVNAEELKGIKVAVLPLPEQEQVKQLCDKSFAKFQSSKSFYLQAERMVLEEIAWEKLNLSQPKWWTVPVTHARQIHRVDAEHSQPKYDKLISHLKSIGSTKQVVDLLIEPIRKGVTPDYRPDGSVIVVNSQHLGRYYLDYQTTDRTIQSFWEENKRAQIHQNDVMIYATGAYIGRTNCYLENERALAGIDILLVRTRDECNPLYLAVFLNALPGLMQSKKFSSGSAQAHIYPEDVSQYWVYVPPEQFQKKVADLVQQSYTAYHQAKSLLEEAIHKVEYLIESK